MGRGPRQSSSCYTVRSRMAHAEEAGEQHLRSFLPCSAFRALTTPAVTVRISSQSEECCCGGGAPVMGGSPAVGDSGGLEQGQVAAHPAGCDRDPHEQLRVGHPVGAASNGAVLPRRREQYGRWTLAADNVVRACAVDIGVPVEEAVHDRHRAFGRWSDDQGSVCRRPPALLSFCPSVLVEEGGFFHRRSGRARFGRLETGGCLGGGAHLEPALAGGRFSICGP